MVALDLLGRAGDSANTASIHGGGVTEFSIWTLALNIGLLPLGGKRIGSTGGF